MFLKWFGQIFASCDCQFKYPGCLKAIQLEDAYDSSMAVCMDRVRRHSLFHFKSNFRNLLSLSFNWCNWFFSLRISVLSLDGANVRIWRTRMFRQQLISNDSNIGHIIIYITYDLHTKIQISASMTRSILIKIFCNLENHFIVIIETNKSSISRAHSLISIVFCFM